MDNYNPNQPPQQQPVAPPQNYLVWAILSTICCCLPFGIVSIFYSTQVSSKMAAGDIAGAYDCSNKAKTWAIVSAIVGAIVNSLSFFFGLFGALAENL